MNEKRTAIVLLELQNDFLSAGGKLYPLLKPLLNEYQVLSNVNQLIAGARAQGMLIAHVPIQFSSDYREMGPTPYGILKAIKDAGALVKGTWGAELAPVINRQDSDFVIDGKSSIDAFAGTHLDFVLRAHGITTIALAGQLTNICIESTMRTAYDKGYQVLGITDATATLGLEDYRLSVQHNWPMFSTPVSHQEFLARHGHHAFTSINTADDLERHGVPA